ncbi:phage regulatory protein/antirepressor Ant [Lactobacillus salivarius]|uniref:phage regulatory protein/antirepressor Ant n=1 Tax=Ligilactobacillus salivarius TaxID=1624 RepID=UPI0014737594|nr:phage regulatory protein/antirepressor Ant [Ligilactobacillus salivarius]NME23707.1 phage regulatory protein/antirepressor Ant [Ligilactobacillus salivarius]
MNDLVIMHNKQAVTTSLVLAEAFGKEHKNVIRVIETKIRELKIEQSSKMFFKGEYINSQNKQQPMYYLNRDGFTFIAMGFTGRKADEFKLKYIDAFNRMEEQIKQAYLIQKQDSYMITDPVQRAKRWIEEQEEHQVKLDKEVKKNEILKPKALFADSVAASHTTILIGELAKILRGNGINIGANRLFQWMRDQGYLISRKGTDYNMPTQRSMNLGLFKIKESTITHSNGSVSISKTTKVTGKGQQYFINKFMKMNETA